MVVELPLGILVYCTGWRCRALFAFATSSGSTVDPDVYIFVCVLAQRKREISYYCKRTSETWPVSLL
jgi:hypothetical protein